MSLHNLQLVVPEAYIGELNCLSNGLQMTTIKSIEPNRLISQKLTDLSNYLLCMAVWDTQVKSMMRRILNTSHGHLLTK